MEDIKTRLGEARDTFLGYPCNTAYDFSEVADLLNYHINNVGDPWSSSTYRANTKDIEREVLQWFADLWGINKDSFWGYITNGSTESNMEGLYVGRESLSSDAIFYASKESHYSIFKIATILKLNICIVNAQENGEIDYRDFEEKLEKYSDKDVLLNVNLGTTMKGAIDNPQEIYRILKKHNKHKNYYMHADGALMGFVLPYLEKDLFFKSHINSISISGHKFPGIMFPCGVFLMEKRFLEKVQKNIEYIGSRDCTISGSRNGHAALFLKHIIQKKGANEFKKDVEKCIELSEYLVGNIPMAWRNHNSITVIFPKPSQEIIIKWQLATCEDISHVIVMPHVTKEKLDRFIEDYCKESNSL